MYHSTAHKTGSWGPAWTGQTDSTGCYPCVCKCPGCYYIGIPVLSLPLTLLLFLSLFDTLQARVLTPSVYTRFEITIASGSRSRSRSYIYAYTRYC